MAKTSGSFQRKVVPIVTPEMAEYMFRQGSDIRGEYRKLRKRAEQRLRDLAAGGGKNLDIYRDYKNRFPTLTEIGSGASADMRMLYDAMSEVTRFLNMKSSTIGGYREILSQAETSFRRHYGDELPSMPWPVFGELMRSIRQSANADAYYRNWKKAYRAVLSSADRANISPERLTEAVKAGQITIGVKGGLLDAKSRRGIARKWSALGK